MLNSVHYDTITGAQITNSILNDASNLFSEHYAIWGERSHNSGSIFPCTFPFSLLPLIQHLPGSRVKLSPQRLREQVFPDPSAGYYVKVTVDGTLAGHVFACQTSSYQQQK